MPWPRDGWLQPGEHGKDQHRHSRCGMEDLENICLFHFLVIYLIKANWNTHLKGEVSMGKGENNFHLARERGHKEGSSVP